MKKSLRCPFFMKCGIMVFLRKLSELTPDQYQNITANNNDGNVGMNASLVKFLLIAGLSLTLFSCDKKIDEESSSRNVNTKNTVLGFDEIILPPKETTNRWYFSEQAERGKVIFSRHSLHL